MVVESLIQEEACVKVMKYGIEHIGIILLDLISRPSAVGLKTMRINTQDSAGKELATIAIYRSQANGR